VFCDKLPGSVLVRDLQYIQVTEAASQIGTGTGTAGEARRILLYYISDSELCEHTTKQLPYHSTGGRQHDRVFPLALYVE
jgi:hypothetical protein